MKPKATRPTQRVKKSSPHPQPTPSSPAPTGYWVRSRTALDDYLRHAPEAVRELQVDQKAESAVRAQLSAAGLRLPVTVAKATSPAEESELAFRVQIEPLSAEALWAHLRRDQPKAVLCLDHIQDPRNLGAIVRSAAFFGIHHIIAPSRRQVLLTDAAVSTAQGGFALVRLYVVPNLSRTLATLKEEGYWILGAAADGVPLGPKSFHFDRMALVLGAEHEGLSPIISSNCDALIAIPRSPTGFDSLNVSVAAGIMLHEMMRPASTR